jgi:D-alanine-D-alanine ligase-like ATP-grasp enzyme
MTTQKIKKSGCVQCGNNPTSHLNAWIDSTIFVLTNPFSQTFFQTRLGRTIIESTDVLFEHFCELLALAGIIHFDTNVSCITIGRARILHEEMSVRGGVMETALIFGRSIDIYRITFASGRKIFFSGLPRLDAVESASAGWMDDKANLKLRLEKAGVAVSKGGSAKSWWSAKRYFKEIDGPVIVKPRLGSRGRHTTTHITTLSDLKRAYRTAKKMCHFVIVEEHLVGSVYRATLIGGRLAGVLAGDPPRITGDGVHTIAELIALKNTHRDTRVSEVTISDTLSIFLTRLNYTLATVLESGHIIDLSEKIGLSYGGNAREVTPYVHSKLRTQLEYATSVVNDSILGFDFITTDVSADPDTIKWGIIECNAMPFIDLHIDPLEGESVNVAKILLDHIEAGLNIPAVK